MTRLFDEYSVSNVFAHYALHKPTYLLTYTTIWYHPDA